MPLTVKRKNIRLYPNPKRVIARFYIPGKPDRVKSIIARVIKLPEKEARQVLDRVLRNFSKRHRNITRIFETNYLRVKNTLSELSISESSLSTEKKLLIGSYFTKEYSIEGTAFFNPSIVKDPYQGNLQNGEKRIIFSFRAVGEAHISSIVFRRGIIDRNNNLEFEPAGNLLDMPEVVQRHHYRKQDIIGKLIEMKVEIEYISKILDRLDEEFTYGELQDTISDFLNNGKLSIGKKKAVEAINWLASSHYEIKFSFDTAISERVIYPISETERNGIEDARFVRFMDDDGRVVYYATYTAYNGFSILPKLLETEDFYHFKVMPIHGEYAQNKGMSLFPRKIDGKYAMISRCDGVNLYIMFSDKITFWKHAEKLQQPEYPWEFVQIGNAGSPIETSEGWLLITHRVGPMKVYSLGVSLLDLKNPKKVIGRLKEPILMPNEDERDGYVPNVVYSCGSIIHNGELIIPYGVADYATTFACIPLEELFNNLTRTE